MQETQKCLFCRIATGKLHSQKVYEDDKVLAFLDIRPINRGHTLVIPKDHYENIHDIPEDLISHVYKIVKKIADAQKKVFSPTGIAVAQNNGKSAGQIVFHFHTHIIPKDQVNHQRYDASEEKLNKIAEKLKQAIEDG